MRPSTTHLLTAAWALLTATLLLWPSPKPPGMPALPDWFAPTVHFVLFFGMALLLGRSLLVARQPQPLLAGMLLSFAYGMVLEVAQIAVEGRGAEWFDVGMNGLGAFAGVLILRFSIGSRGAPGPG